MNYDKKRKRQSGLQKCKPSERYLARWEAHYGKIGQEIDRLISEGILPPITFGNEPSYEHAVTTETIA